MLRLFYFEFFYQARSGMVRGWVGLLWFFWGRLAFGTSPPQTPVSPQGSLSGTFKFSENF